MEMYNEDYDNDPLNDNLSEIGEILSEAEEDNTLNEDGEPIAEYKEPKPVKVKRPVLNPQPKLNFQALQGPKGLLALNELFKDFKFRGSGHESEDLANILKNLEQWAFRLFPKFHFEDSLKRFESLGKKREVQVYLKKIRQGMIDNDEIIRQVDDDDHPHEEDVPEQMSVEPQLGDEFDELLSQQISQAAHPPPVSSLSEEVRARIERNKQLALERKKKKEAEAMESSSTNLEESMDVQIEENPASCSAPMQEDSSVE